jgi:hypothetical protein
VSITKQSVGRPDSVEVVAAEGIKLPVFRPLEETLQNFTTAAPAAALPVSESKQAIAL